jgi:hypothetical protein
MPGNFEFQMSLETGPSEMMALVVMMRIQNILSGHFVFYCGTGVIKSIRVLRVACSHAQSLFGLSN